MFRVNNKDSRTTSLTSTMSLFWCFYCWIWTSKYWMVSWPMEKQSLADVLQKTFLQRFCNIYRKTSVLESLLSNVVCLKAYNFIKKRLHQRCFPCEIYKMFQIIFEIFYRTPPVAASASVPIYFSAFQYFELDAFSILKWRALLRSGFGHFGTEN